MYNTTESEDGLTCNMSTLEVLIAIYKHALELEDDALATCALARMRFYMGRSNFEHAALLDGVRFTYQSSEKDMLPVRRIFLAGMVLNSDDLAKGAYKDKYYKYRKEVEGLDRDLAHALI